MALDQTYYSRYGKRRNNTLEAEDDRALISRARDVISRATGQLPTVPGGWDQQRLVTASGSSWEEGSYSAAVDGSGSGDEDRKDEYHDASYKHEDRRSRRHRRRERRREERRASSDKPCRTILIKHLPPEVDEQYLRGILQIFGAPIQDVRLVKHKDSGASRGFAFVEFQFLPDAQRWMEENQGLLVIGDGRATLTFSKSRGDEDWFCSQCGTQNFKRRSNCFKCGIQKNESEKYSQISTFPTRILLLTGLDSLTSEDKIQKELRDITAIDMNIQLIRDASTNQSRGLCYVALSTTDFSRHLKEILSNMQPPFMIDGKSISAHFCKEETEGDYSTWADAQTDSTSASADYYEHYYQQAESTAASQYDQSYAGYTAEQYATATQQVQQELSVADKVALAQEQVQAARKQQLEQQQVTQKLLSSLRQESQDTKPKKRKVDLPPPGTDPQDRDQGLEGLVQSEVERQTSTGSENSTYPDMSLYQYDESSGFYYDPQTGLYYDPNSQYFYNAHSQQYMYWDGSQYVPAQHQASAPPNIGAEGPEKEEKTNKKDKGKVAKKVASDMRRWAATMNELKNTKAKKTFDSKKDNSSATADAGFAILSKRADPVETKQSVMLALKRSAPSDDLRSKAAKTSITNILAQYGGDSDSESEETSEPPAMKNQPVTSPAQTKEKASSVPSSLTDWTKLICLLCKRQFPSREVLVKHQQFSDLHKQNLEALKKKTGLQGDSSNQTDMSYRDRAQERRSRFSK